MKPFRIVAAGDAALLVEFEDRIDPAINAQAVALARTLRAAAIPGVRDVLATYRSVAVYFDPLRTNYDRLIARVEAFARTGDGSSHSQDRRAWSMTLSPGPSGTPSPVQIPVCYGGEFGPDLGAVAAFARMAEADVVDRHSARTYRVFMLGFVPGFAYMGTVDERIAAPRHAEPRLRVPAGSVGIAGLQTGIYPAATPGGWQIVGRTPVKPFDLARSEPFLFEPGLDVRFRAIDADEYARLQNAG